MTAAPIASQLAKVAADHFKELGGEIVAEEAVTPTDVDMRPVLTGIGTKKPCVLYFPTFVAVTAQIVRQAPEIPDLKDSQHHRRQRRHGARLARGGRRCGQGLPHHQCRHLARGDGRASIREFVEKYTDEVRRGPDQLLPCPSL